MDFRRFWRHVVMTPGRARRAFPERTLAAIQERIAQGEARHSGEVAFVVESELATAQLWAGLSSRERARQVFAAQGVWNTERNNGVLVYVLLADHRVEIVADRGIGPRVPPEDWQRICDLMDAHFREGRYEQGALEGVEAVGRLLEAHYPSTEAGPNEVGDRPAIL